MRGHAAIYNCASSHHRSFVQCRTHPSLILDAKTMSNCNNSRIAKTAAWIFSPPTSSSDDKRERIEEQQARQRQEERLRARPMFKQKNTADGEDTTPGAPVKQKKRSHRTWSEPMPARAVHQMVVGDRSKFKRGQCCTLRCTEMFSSAETGAGAGREAYNGDFLRKEQDEFRAFGTEVDRKQFVIKHVPPGPLSKGSMMAAGSPVCNFAFMKFFGVTSTLISSVKGTPNARASPSATR